MVNDWDILLTEVKFYFYCTLRLKYKCRKNWASRGVTCETRLKRKGCQLKDKERLEKIKNILSK